MASKVTFSTDVLLGNGLQDRPAWERWLFVYIEARLAEGPIQTSLPELVEAMSWKVGVKLVGPQRPAISGALDRLAEPSGWEVTGSLYGLAIRSSDAPGRKKRASSSFSRKNAYADAFKAAFDAHFGAKYTWLRGDFVQLSKWRAAYPEVTAEGFADAAAGQWSREQHCPRYSLTIRGLCVNWPTMLATMKTRVVDTRTPAEKALCEARRLEAMEALQATQEGGG